MNDFRPPSFLPAVICTAGSPTPAFTAFVDPPPTGQVGVPYSFWLTTNPGADGTYTSTALPADLSLSTAGVITGTPSTPGTTVVTITLTSAGAKTVAKSFTFVILP